MLVSLFPPCTPAEAEARLLAVYGALRAALDMNARGMLERNPHTGQAWSAASSAVVLSTAVSQLTAQPNRKTLNLKVTSLRSAAPAVSRSASNARA